MRAGGAARGGRWLLGAALALGLGGTAQGQDIEMMSRLAGRPLPAAYYARIQADPDFFQIDRGWATRARDAATARDGLGGTLRLAVVPALFADSPEPVVAADVLQRILFDGPADGGTVTDFYTEASGGRLVMTGETLPWVRTGVSRDSAIGTSFGLGGDAATAAYLSDALAAADTLTDFGAFDNDGPDGVPNSGDDDGFVDAIAFHFIEVAASCGGDGFWPHRSRLQNWLGAPYLTDDEGPDGAPIAVDSYIIQSAVDCSGSEPATITVISHELGHVLGLPDYYDPTDGSLPEQRRWVLGCWSLMAAGAWGCGPVTAPGAERPTHIGAWERVQLGWVDEVTDAGPALNAEFRLEPVLAAGQVLRVPLRGELEFLLLEHRTQDGFDAGLPSSGVLVYHIEPNRPRWPCRTCEKIYEAGLVEADGNGALVRLAADGGNRGEAGDAFGWAGPRRLTNGTTPSVRLNTGANSGVTFHEIAVEDGVARIRVSTTAITTTRLLRRFLYPSDTPLTAEEEAFLDAVGNGNGRYDVGDLRAYLRDFPDDGR